MSKVIISPFKRWPGSVTLSDPMSYPQFFAFSDAINKSQELGDNTTLMKYNYELLSGICPCVEKWELKGLPENITRDNGFPSSPVKASQELASWLISEVTKIYRDEELIPNE